jgi:heme/copper-type cytochrome/quinol oxidase subunit 3
MRRNFDLFLCYVIRISYNVATENYIILQIRADKSMIQSSNSTRTDSFEIGVGVRMSAILLVFVPFILFFTIIFYYIRKYRRTGHAITFTNPNQLLQNDEPDNSTQVLKSTSATVMTSSSDLEFANEEDIGDQHQVTNSKCVDKVQHLTNSKQVDSGAFPAVSTNTLLLSTFTAWMNQHLYSSVEHTTQANNRQSVEPIDFDQDEGDEEDRGNATTHHPSNSLLSVSAVCAQLQ